MARQTERYCSPISDEIIDRYCSYNVDGPEPSVQTTQRPFRFLPPALHFNWAKMHFLFPLSSPHHHNQLFNCAAGRHRNSCSRQARKLGRLSCVTGVRKVCPPFCLCLFLKAKFQTKVWFYLSLDTMNFSNVFLIVSFLHPDRK